MGASRETVLRWVTITMVTVIGLTFLFGFGNVLSLGLWLGGAGVYRAVGGAGGGPVGARPAAGDPVPGGARCAGQRVTVGSAVAVVRQRGDLALKRGGSGAGREFGKAAFNAVGPLLLIGWAVPSASVDTLAGQQPATTSSGRRVRGVGRTSWRAWRVTSSVERPRPAEAANVRISGLVASRNHA